MCLERGKSCAGTLSHSPCLCCPVVVSLGSRPPRPSASCSCLPRVLVVPARREGTPVHALCHPPPHSTDVLLVSLRGHFGSSHGESFEFLAIRPFVPLSRLSHPSSWVFPLGPCACRTKSGHEWASPGLAPLPRRARRLIESVRPCSGRLFGSHGHAPFSPLESVRPCSGRLVRVTWARPSAGGPGRLSVRSFCTPPGRVARIRLTLYSPRSGGGHWPCRGRASSGGYRCGVRPPHSGREPIGRHIGGLGRPVRRWTSLDTPPPTPIGHDPGSGPGSGASWRRPDTPSFGSTA